MHGIGYFAAQGTEGIGLLSGAAGDLVPFLGAWFAGTGLTAAREQMQGHSPGSPAFNLTFAALGFWTLFGGPL